MIRLAAIGRMAVPACAILLSAAPASAAAYVSTSVAWALGSGLAAALVVVVWLYVQWTRIRAVAAVASRENERIIEHMPVGLIRWRAGEASFSPRVADLLEITPPSGDIAADEADRIVVTAAPESDRERLKGMLDALHRDATGFEAEVAISGEMMVSLRGDSLDGDVSLWITDTSNVASLGTLLSASQADTSTLQSLLDRIPLPIWWRDSIRKIAGCNRAYAEAMDCDRKTVLAEQRELSAGYIDDGGHALAETAARTGMAQSESHHVVIGNSRRLLEFTEAPLGAAGEAIGGYATDATALEALQDQLADHIAAHAEVLEGLNTAIAIFGADKRLKFFNTAYANQTGIDASMLQGEPNLSEVLEWLGERRRLPEIIDFPDYKAERDRWFTTLIEPIEELLHLPDETTFRFVASPHPLGGLIFAMEDVTDKLALESSYNTQIEVQRETLNNLYEGIAVFGGDGRLKLLNRGMAKIWDLPDELLAGDPHISDIVESSRQFFPDDADWPKLKQRIILVVTERSVRSGRLQRADGTVVRYAVVPLPDGNTLLTFLDISDSARVERALRERNVALENADRIKSEFIGNVSYELRTPLNAIVGFTEILDNRYFGDLTERQAEYVECILQASTHLMTLIDDILDLATIEAGYMALDLQDVDIGALMNGLAEVATERAEQSGLKIRVDCPDDVGTLLADSVRLRQALFNLVSNAIQFTPAGGTVTLAARRDDENLLVTVTDTGIGIAPEDQERVFERFERGDPNARESGTGLGLALVKSLLALHGGSVALESIPGEGTRAICRIPLSRDAAD